MVLGISIYLSFEFKYRNRYSNDDLCPITFFKIYSVSCRLAVGTSTKNKYWYNIVK